MKKYLFTIVMIGFMSENLQAQGPVGKTTEKRSTLSAIELEDTLAIVRKGYSTATTRRVSTQASSSVGGEQMGRFSTLNPQNALYGLLPGLTVLQGGGPVYEDNPTIQLRGLGTFKNADPLILVDGIERPLERLSISEIEDVTVLKDAAAVAPYGIRGANGVILVTTKRGQVGKMKVDVQYRHNFNQPFRLPAMVDAPTYAQALNEALANDGMAPRYSESEIGMFRDGSNPDKYPNVDWKKETIRPVGQSNELDLSFVGGSDRIRYFSHIHYGNDFGLVKSLPTVDGYDTQLTYYRLNLRTNLDVKLTPTTQMRLNLMGSLDDQNRPNLSADKIFQNFVNIPAAAFPIKHSNGHWGGNQVYTTQNPVASITDNGFIRVQNRALFADLTIQQDFGMWLEGLTGEVSVGYDNAGEYRDIQNRSFAYYSDGQLYNQGKETLSFSTSLNTARMNMQGHVKLNYGRMFGESHQLNLMWLSALENRQTKGRNNLVIRQNNLLTASYGYKERYLIEAVGAYSGSSYLSKHDKYRFYPTVSAGWVLSSEDFMQKASWIQLLKVRASYGLSGVDNLEYELDRKFYADGNSYWFGSSLTSNNGLREGRLATQTLEPELAKKFNVGIDMDVLHGLSFTFDIFKENRSHILLAAGGTTSAVLGAMNPSECVGKMSNKGLEASIAYQGKWNDFEYGIRGQFAFSRNKIVDMKAEEGYQPYDYMYRTGLPYGTYFGLEAIGLFQNQAEITNSLEQSFSQVQPGDVKYADINGDKVIDRYDVKALGYSTLYPEINYGFTLSAAYKGLGVNALFQGVENYQTTRTASGVYWPMYNNGNVSEWYYDRRWTEDTKATATMPRLTTVGSSNNYRASSLWLEDGSFLKLRSLEVYYNLPQSWLKPIKIENFRMFARGHNLFSWDHLGDADPEMTGVKYPSMRSYVVGCSIHF